MRQQSLISTLIGLTIILVVLAVGPLAPANAEFGTNWTAQFYNCTDFACGVAATVLYPNGINFVWGNGSPTDSLGVPIAGVNPNGFAVRFSSTQSFVGGTYDFILTSDDGVRLYIDGNLVLDKFVARPLTTDTIGVTLTAGTHSIIVEYFDNVDAATIQVQWVPQGTFTGTPGITATAVPVAKASVVSVRGLSVRTGPYLGASLITIARPGTEYDVAAKNSSEGIYTWYLITVGERQGWASGRYLQLNVDPATIPSQNTIFDQIDNAPDIGVRGYPRAVMNLRVRPSIRTQRLDQIPWGDEVIIIGRTVQAGQNRWYHVRWKDKIGWIFAPYVTVRGPLDAVPIR